MKTSDARKILGRIKTRCYNPNSKSYKWYGGKGIKVCDRWMDDTRVERFYQGTLNFIEDMSEGWSEGLTIDRIDSDGDYCPENCRWITHSENVIKANKNPKRDNSRHIIEYNKTRKGCSLSKDHKKKISEGVKAIMTDETKEKMRVARKGYKHSPETIKKIKASNKGKKRSSETIEKIKIAQRERRLREKAA